MRLVQTAMIIPLCIGSIAFAQRQMDVAGFRLGEDAQRYVTASNKNQARNETVTERMTAAGGLSGPYTFNLGGMFMDVSYGTRVAHVPSEGGRVDIAFLCPEEGNASYSISQHRRFEGVEQADVANVLIKKYGQPTNKFSAPANRSGTVMYKYMYWSNDGIPMTRDDMESLGSNEGFKFKGGGLLVQLVPKLSSTAVWLQLLTRGWETRSQRCLDIKNTRAHEAAKSNINFLKLISLTHCNFPFNFAGGLALEAGATLTRTPGLRRQ